MSRDPKAQFHESVSRHRRGRESSDRAFGLIFAVFFLVVGLWPALHGTEPRVWSVTIGIAFLFTALLFSRALHPLKRGWLRFGEILQRIATPLIFTALFFLVVTPVAILLRWMGKDLLEQKLDRGRSSYWRTRAPDYLWKRDMKRAF
jgi:hypothetical protein